MRKVKSEVNEKILAKDLSALVAKQRLGRE